MPVTALEHVHVLCAEPHWHTIDFFSDLHLDSTQPATLQALQRYLQHSPAQALFILGDLFETWIGDDVLSHRPTGFEAQVCALLAETAQQRELFCLHGNRDFLLGPDFAAASHVRLLPDPTVLVFAQQRQLDLMQAQLRLLYTQLQSAGGAAEPRNLRDEIPPHY